MNKGGILLLLLKGKRVVVLGGISGIGLVVVKVFFDEFV